MKAIHNYRTLCVVKLLVVVYLKDTEKWKQFTTFIPISLATAKLLCISKILKNESNSQQLPTNLELLFCCCVSQRYWKMKAIHNNPSNIDEFLKVVVYLKDTEKWKQFTTFVVRTFNLYLLLCISKILKNESNSQHNSLLCYFSVSCCVSQRYWKMKAIHNPMNVSNAPANVVVYLKDTEKWKQFTTVFTTLAWRRMLLCISKILKNESNSQLVTLWKSHTTSCCVSQRYWKMKAIHNYPKIESGFTLVVVYLKDTEKWKQFTTIKS